MKQIILMRHAKADDHFSGSDLSRPLIQEGIEIQKMVTQYMQKNKLLIEAIFYSPYKRAEETAQIIKEYYPLANLIKEPALGTVFDSYTILQHVEKKGNDHTLLVGHAPTLSIFAQSLLMKPKLIEFDKSGFSIINFKEQIGFGLGELFMTVSPKEIF